MADEKVLPKTPEEFLLSAGVHPEVVKANEGILNEDQIKLLKQHHGEAVATFYVDSVSAMNRLKQDQKQKAEAERAAQVRGLFQEYEVKDPDKLFNEMREWAKANYSPEDFKELQADTHKGGRAQKAALKEIAEGYLKDNPLSVKVSGGVDGDTSTPVTSGYITAGEYTDQLRALQKRGLKDDHADIKALGARRMASRKQENKK